MQMSSAHISHYSCGKFEMSKVTFWRSVQNSCILPVKTVSVSSTKLIYLSRPMQIYFTTCHNHTPFATLGCVVCDFMIYRMHSFTKESEKKQSEQENTGITNFLISLTTNKHDAAPFQCVPVWTTRGMASSNNMQTWSYTQPQEQQR